MTLGLAFAVMLVLAIGLALHPLLAKGNTERKKGKNTQIFAGLAVLIVAAAGVVYYFLGTPVLVKTPAFLQDFDAAGEIDPANPSIDDWVEGLKTRVAENPGDARGWIRLANSLMGLERTGEAFAAYRQAINIAPENGAFRFAFAEALVLSSDDGIPGEAAAGFEAAIARNHEALISRLYLGDYAFQNGKIQLAFEGWVALFAEIPEATPWLPALAERIREAALRLELDPPSLLAEKQYQAPPTPAADDIQQMNPEDQQALIEGMVANLAARLEENPGDLAGWERLARSSMVLGRYQDGIKAYALIAGARADDPVAQENYVQAILTYLEATGQHITDRGLAALLGLIALDPENPTALFFLGQTALERGDAASAQLYWQRLLALIDPASDGAEIVRQKLISLGE